MAYDEGLAQILRDDLCDFDAIVEKKMFGGICFMYRGNMLAGIHKNGAMFRVGKERHAEALKMDGASPMDFTGRPMNGFIDVAQEAFVNDEKRAYWLELAVKFCESLPPK